MTTTLTLQLSAKAVQATLSDGLMFVEAVCPQGKHASDDHLCQIAGQIPPVEAGAQITVTVPCDCDCHRQRSKYPGLRHDVLGQCKQDGSCSDGYVTAFTATVAEVLPVVGNERTPRPRVYVWMPGNGTAMLAEAGRSPIFTPIDLTVWPDVTPGNWYCLMFDDVEEA